MASRVLGLFDDRNEAQDVERELVQAGISDDNIALLAQSGRPAEERGGFWDDIRRIFGMDTPEEERSYYEEGARRGGTLVSVEAPDERVSQVVDIMQRHHPVDIERRAEEWRRGGWQAAPAQPMQQQGEQTIPVAEEQLKVGKRRIEKGGVRIYSHVTEQPVQKQVELREEQVRVERRPVDRPAGEGAFQERTVEATESREEPVVSKEARIVEEVSLQKETQERQETIRDTLRRTEVDVEQIGEEELRRDFESNYASSGAQFEEYRPAYLFGQQAAGESIYMNRQWVTIEPQLRQSFEQRHPGQWERFSNAVRYGFERGGRRRS